MPAPKEGLPLPEPELNPEGAGEPLKAEAGSDLKCPSEASYKQVIEEIRTELLRLKELISKP